MSCISLNSRPRPACWLCATVQLLLQQAVINLHLFQRQIRLYTDFRITAISLPSSLLYSLFVAYPVPTPTHLLVCTNNLLLRVSLFTFSSTFLCPPPTPTDHCNIMKNRSSVQSFPSVNKHAKRQHRHVHFFNTKSFFPDVTSCILVEVCQFFRLIWSPGNLEAQLSLISAPYEQYV